MMRKDCPACSSKAATIFYEASQVPAHSCLMFASPEQALAFPRGDVKLAFCHDCGFIFNSAFLAEHKKYDQQYEDQQIFSPTFTEYARKAVRRLIEKYGLRNKKITEIGCGKADFLTLLCEMGDNQGVGIDPTARLDRLSPEARRRITLVAEYFSVDHSALIGNAVICRHTLEHIDEPHTFLLALRQALAKKMDTAIFFDIPDTQRILTEKAFWDVYYEHCSYFTENSARRLFQSSGFKVTNIEDDFAGQWLCLEARPSEETRSDESGNSRTVEQTKSAVGKFSREVADYIKSWREKFAAWERRSTRLAIWGSGSKCVAFLSTLKVGNKLQIIDINPHRQGQYMPGLDIKIEAPEALIATRPEVVVVMNPIYCEEIQIMLKNMGLKPQIIAVGKDA